MTGNTKTCQSPRIQKETSIDDSQEFSTFFEEKEIKRLGKGVGIKQGVERVTWYRCGGCECYIEPKYHTPLKVTPVSIAGWDVPPLQFMSGLPYIKISISGALHIYSWLDGGKSELNRVQRSRSTLVPRSLDSESNAPSTTYRGEKNNVTPTLYVWISSLSIFSKQCWTTRVVTPSSDSSVNVLPENLKIYGVVKKRVARRILLCLHRMHDCVTGQCDVCTAA